MKRLLRWALVVVIAFIAVVAAIVLSRDKIARSVAEKRIRAETGMEARIESLETDLQKQAVHIKGFKLINPPEFGGSIFLHIPELRVELDLEALRNNQLHFKLVRVDLAELHVVEDKDGRKNIELFQKQGKRAGRKEPVPPADPAPSPARTNDTEQIQFAGIDTLNVSIGRLKYTSARFPQQNQDREVGLRDREFNDIQNEKDLQAVAMVIALQGGVSMMLNDPTASPGDLFKGGSDAGAEAKRILKDLIAPLSGEK